MNFISLVGRLTKKPELKINENKRCCCRFDIAVDNSYTDKSGNKVKQADFISCVCWDNTAENLCKYQNKGNRIGVIGRLHTYSYDKQDGSKGYAYDVMVNTLEYLESKPKEESPIPEYGTPTQDSMQTSEDPYEEFAQGTEISPDDLPF